MFSCDEPRRLSRWKWAGIREKVSIQRGLIIGTTLNRKLNGT